MDIKTSPKKNEIKMFEIIFDIVKRASWTRPKQHRKGVKSEIMSFGRKCANDARIKQN